ncbi:MAG TPA: GNAT family N-acetyltransferase [Ilumatobacteraceae bacterium]|nr:GNAT family N-acetyltransferase [Ilumatobacteraceae bacterium]
MELSIRTARVGDHDVLADIFRRASLSNAGDRDNLLAHPELLVFDRAWIEHGRVRVAVVAGRVVGFATTRPVDDDTAELDDLFVDPGRMRRGVARALVSDAVAAARGEGRSRIDVSANVHAGAFYEAVGFVSVGTVDTLFGPTPRMRLDLGEVDGPALADSAARRPPQA